MYQCKAYKNTLGIQARCLLGDKKIKLVFFQNKTISSAAIRAQWPYYQHECNSISEIFVWP